MNYWHMQLHPNDKNWGKEKELLETKGLIGIGKTNLLKNSINIGDIILIKAGSKPIALVEVTGEYEDIKKNDFDKLDWFQYRRAVKVLAYASEDSLPFPYPRATLKKAVNHKTKSYQYIYNWHQKTLLNKHKTDDFESNNFYMMSDIYIKKHKILNTFNLKFTNKKGVPLPIIIIAGKNGVGKTSLFEYLSEYHRYYLNDKENYITVIKNEYSKEQHQYRVSINTIQKGVQGIQKKINQYKDNLEYIPALANNLMNVEMNVEEEIVNYYINLMLSEDLAPSKVIHKLRSFMQETFASLSDNFNFYISRVDINQKEKQVWFKSSVNETEFSIDDLSTGEKTLFSKVFYLYLKQFNNKIILIDEPELSLHPSWQNQVLKIYEDFAINHNCQIIIATHSPHIIGSAKNEYIRVLRKNENDEIEVIDNFSKSYGLEFDKVLKDVMELEENRTPKVAKKIKALWYLLEQEKYTTSEYQDLYQNLENYLGSLDKDLLLARLEVAKLKSKNNAKFK